MTMHNIIILLKLFNKNIGTYLLQASLQVHRNLHSHVDILQTLPIYIYNDRPDIIQYYIIYN